MSGEPIDWKVGERCVQQVEKQPWYTGTVKGVHDKRLDVLWDDPDFIRTVLIDKDKVQRLKT